MAKLETHNDLKSNTRKTVIDILNARLADAIDLALITKQAHWNVKGPTFIAVHELLDTLRTGLDEHVDTIAERVAQLGGMALGTSQSVAGRTPLAPYPTDISKVSDHLEALVERYAATAKLVRKAIEDCDEAGDADAADIFTAYSRTLDKSLWFLESHLQPG
ncbi:MAG: DNA starvation/stationary phase protection protein Dps [Rhizobiaceae bacterium]|nr:DNA starvation/stationary phase protection protein Dps [Rhizobiaceae bacterium]